MKLSCGKMITITYVEAKIVKQKRDSLLASISYDRLPIRLVSLMLYI